MKHVFTEEAIAQIPKWVAENITADEIAARLGCTVASLRVRASHYKISLRTPNWRELRKRKKRKPETIELPKAALIEQLPKPKVVPDSKVSLTIETSLTLSRVARSLLRQKAEEIGCTEAALATNLLELIARDNLFAAVLDAKKAADSFVAADSPLERLQKLAEESQAA